MPTTQGIRSSLKATIVFVIPPISEVAMAMMADNIFLKIINKQIPAKIAYEDDQCLAFHDISPQAPVHVLIIPRKAIRLHANLAAEDTALMGHLHMIAVKLAEQLGVIDGYR